MSLEELWCLDGAECAVYPPPLQLTQKLVQQQSRQVRALAVDDARAAAKRVAVHASDAHGGVGDKAGGLGATDHGHLEHLAQKLQHQRRLTRVKQQQTEVAAHGARESEREPSQARARESECARATVCEFARSELLCRPCARSRAELRSSLQSSQQCREPSRGRRAQSSPGKNRD